MFIAFFKFVLFPVNTGSFSPDNIKTRKGNKENKPGTMRHNLLYTARRVCAALIMMVAGFASTANAQEVIRLSGTVLSKDSNEPLIGVNISDANTKRALAATDADGKFAFNVYSNASLRFSMVGR